MSDLRPTPTDADGVDRSPPPAHEEIGWLIGGLLLASSAVALAIAPTALDSSYSWVEHTTSESAAQRVAGAWLARTGFALFGLGVLWTTAVNRLRWTQIATALHTVFAVAMIAVATFSSRSWIDEAPYDETEDLLHSISASVMGFAFAFGVVAVGAQFLQIVGRWRLFDGIAVAASVVLPIGMTIFESVDGVLQRAMFAIAYFWYGRELLNPRPG